MSRMKRVVLAMLVAWWVKCDEVVQAASRVLAPMVLFGLAVEYAAGSLLPSPLTHIWVYVIFAIILTATARQGLRFWELGFAEVKPPTNDRSATAAE